MKPTHKLLVMLGVMSLQSLVMTYAADKPTSPASSVKEPAPRVTTPIIKLNPPRSVTNPNPALRDNMHIDLGRGQLQLYKRDSAALTRLKQKIQLFQARLVELDRFAGGQSSRIERCTEVTYTTQQQEDAGCGQPGTTLAECSYMLLVNCMGGVDTFNRDYQSYVSKTEETNNAAQEVLAAYANMKTDIASALAALGPVSESEGNTLPTLNLPLTWPSH